MLTIFQPTRNNYVTIDDAVKNENSTVRFTCPKFVRHASRFACKEACRKARRTHISTELEEMVEESIAETRCSPGDQDVLAGDEAAELELASLVVRGASLPLRHRDRGRLFQGCDYR